MAEREWKQGDPVWFWSKKVHDWAASTVWWCGVAREQKCCILDSCLEHLTGYSVYVCDLRPRDPALGGKDKPKEASDG